MRGSVILAVMLGASFVASPAWAQGKSDESADETKSLGAMREAEPERWSDRRPKIDTLLRLGIGLGYFFYENNSPSQTRFDAFGLQAAFSVGDSFFDRFGYMATVRAAPLMLQRTIVDGITREYESDEQAAFVLEGAAGAEIWLIPRKVSVGGQLVYSTLSYAFEPRNVLTGPTEGRAFLGQLGWRGTLMFSKQEEHAGINGMIEFQRNFTGTDPEDGSAWRGTHTIFGASFQF